MPLDLDVKKKSLSNRSLRVIFAALVLSVLGHLVLFFGVPFLSPSLPSAISDELIIKSDLLLALPKKIKMARSPKKKPAISSDQGNATAYEPSGQGGLFDQQGQAFRLPESGILYYDAYVDGQKYQTGELQA